MSCSQLRSQESIKQIRASLPLAPFYTPLLHLYKPLFHSLLNTQQTAIRLISLLSPIKLNMEFSSSLILQLLFLASLFHISLAGRTISELVQDPPSSLLKYHKGSLLSGKISVNLIWYGKFKPSQRAIVSDFIQSLYTQTHSPQQPSVSSWWKTTEKYYHLVSNKHPSLNLTMGKQILDESYSLGKSLTDRHIRKLAAKGDKMNAVNVVLTASDVAVDGFCSSRCGTHGSAAAQNSPKMTNKSYKFAYIWVGNSETQCPGQCAWPFHQPIYGPQSPPLIAPNNDVGLDGMVINIASLLAGTATNPFGNGYYQGPAEAPLEAASACPGVYGKGAYPGYAGELRVDSTTGASYNANGANGRKYLLPAF